MVLRHKRNSSSKILLDYTDLDILETIIEKPNITITELKNKINLAHSNLLVHLKRLEIYLIRKRDKQKIHLSLEPDTYDLVYHFLISREYSILRNESKQNPVRKDGDVSPNTYNAKQ